MPSLRRGLTPASRLLPIMLFCAVAALSLPAIGLGSDAASEQGHAAKTAPSDAEQRYIVVLEDSVNHPGRVAQRHAINRDADLTYVYKTAIEGYAAELTPADKAAVESDPNVAYVERDMPIELFGQEIPNGVRRIGALNNSSLNLAGSDEAQIDADVVVIDTGIDARHPDLNVAGAVMCNVEKNQPPHICANADYSRGFHGTHVAGIVGARDNGIGVVGVAPGVRLWSAGMGSEEKVMSDVVAAVDWSVGLDRIEVINMSLGCSDFVSDASCHGNSASLKAAIGNAIDSGIVVVVAAGNYWEDISKDPFIPASFPDPITVSSLGDFDGAPGGLAPTPSKDECNSRLATQPHEKDDSLAEYSNWGVGVDIAAPGSCVRSTVPLGTGMPGHTDYVRASGTSMAAPHVAGAAAILAATRNPSDREDVMAIRQELLNQGNFNWTDDSGYAPVGDPPDNVQEPLLDIHNSSVFTVPHPGSVGSVGVVSHTAGSIDLFARNASNDIWHKVYQPAPVQWGGWYTEPLPSGVPISGAPAVGSRNPLSRDLFVKGNNSQLYFRNFYSGQGWSSWFWIPAPHGGHILHSPAVTARPDRQDGLDVVVRSDNGLIYFKEYTAPTGWTDWQGMGEPPPGAASSPATAVHMGQYWHIMVRGADGNIWDRAWGEGLGWTGWISLGAPSGGTTSAPALTATESGNDLFLFALGTGGEMWMRKGTPGGWTGWSSLGGQWTSDPAATSMSSAGVSVFASGLDNRIQERRYLYGGWTNWMRIDDNYCPPPECTWEPSKEQFTAFVPDYSDVVAVDSSGTVNSFPTYSDGVAFSDPTKSLQGKLDPALLDGKGHYVIDVADVNNDDDADLITLKDDGKVLVHLGNEDRTFGTALETGITLPPYMNGSGWNEPIAVADVTGDGYDDLVMHDGYGANSVYVYAGQSNGKFSTTATGSLSSGYDSALPHNSGYYFLDAVDVTGDELADLVTMSTEGFAYVHKGEASGKFGAAKLAAWIDPIMKDGSGQEPVGLGDVTGDGKADLVSLDGTTLKLWAGKADATFGTATNPYAGSIDSNLMDGSGQELIGLFDYNRDGREDLVSLKDGDTLAYTAQAGGIFAAPIVTEGEVESVRSFSGLEFAAEKPFVRRPGCTPLGCFWRTRAIESDVDRDARADLVALHTDQEARVFGGVSASFDSGHPEASLAGQLDPALRDGVGHYAVDVGDVDGDGRADLVTMKGEGGFLVHRGGLDSAGKRVFKPGVSSFTAAMPSMNGKGNIEPIAVADVNGDGRGDLVGFNGVSAASHAFTAIGRSDGTFADSGDGYKVSLVGAVNSALRDRSGDYFLDAVDVTGDKRADLVTMNTSGSVRLYPGQSDGSFSSTAATTSVNPIMDDGSGEEPVGLGDVSGDLKADLLTLDGTTLKLRVGQAAGTFAAPYTAYAGTVNSNLTDGVGEELIGLLDHNGDDRADLAAIAADGAMRTYKAQPSGTFAAPETRDVRASTRFNLTGYEYAIEKPLVRRGGCASSGCEWYSQPAEADVDGDGRAELTTVDPSGTAKVYAGLKTGIQASAAKSSLSGALDPALMDGVGQYVVDVADVTGEGRSDLIALGSAGGVSVYPGQSDRSFGAAIAGTAGKPLMNGAGANEPIAIADVTGDGRADYIGFSSYTGGLASAPGKADGGFDNAKIASSLNGTVDTALTDQSGHYFVDAADVTGDERADVVSLNTDGSAYVFKANGDGTFAAPIAASTIDPIMDNLSGSEPIGLADITGDGKADLLTLDGSTLKLWAGKSDATFAASTNPYAGSIDSSLMDGSGEELVALLDYSGDGRADLITAKEGDVLTYTAQSNGTFASPTTNEGEIDSVRGLRPNGQEFASEKVLIRRHGCQNTACKWNSRPTDADTIGDGRANLVSLHSTETIYNWGGNVIGATPGAPTLSFPEALDPALLDGVGQYVIDVADVTGEGRADLVTMGSAGGVSVHPGKVDRGFGAAATTAGGKPLMNGTGPTEPIAVAGVNGDAYADYIGFSQTTGGLTFVPGKAESTFFDTSKAVFSLNGTVDTALIDQSGHYFLDAADVTGDKIADVVSLNTNGSAYVFKGEVGGTFAAPTAAATINPIMDDGSGQEPIGLGDVTGDGRADMLTLDGSTLKLWAGQEGATFAASTSPYGSAIDSNLMDGTGEELIGLLDQSRDGLADLFSLTPTGAGRVYLAQPGATFAAPSSPPMGLTSIRHGEIGHEFASEKPMLRRVGCGVGGCVWP